MKPEIVEIQSWRYKTIVVDKRQQQPPYQTNYSIRALQLCITVLKP